MRLLLDSHVALWWLNDDDALGPDCRNEVETATEVRFSAVTPWELSIKKTLGKLDYPDGLVEELEASGFAALSITAAHAIHAAQLPRHHDDPFDRMLLAQAELEALTLVSADRAFDPYGTPILDPRR